MKKWLKGGLVGVVVSTIYFIINSSIPSCCSGGCIGGSCPNSLLYFFGSLYEYILSFPAAIAVGGFVNFFRSFGTLERGLIILVEFVVVGIILGLLMDKIKNQTQLKVIKILILLIILLPIIIASIGKIIS